MWRSFSFANTDRYIDILDDLLEGYNNSYHRSIKMKPVDVNVLNAQTVWKTLYKKESPPIRYTFKVGDMVRISRFKRTFAKGYLPDWSEEVFTIVKRRPRRPPVYRIKEYDSSLIVGTFYEKELQKITFKDTDLFRIDDIIKTEGSGRNKKYLMKWRGWPAKYNSSILASSLKSLA